MDEFKEVADKSLQLQHLCKMKVKEMEMTQDPERKREVWREVMTAEEELIELFKKINLAYIKPIGNA